MNNEGNIEDMNNKNAFDAVTSYMNLESIFNDFITGQFNSKLKYNWDFIMKTNRRNRVEAFIRDNRRAKAVHLVILLDYLKLRYKKQFKKYKVEALKKKEKATNSVLELVTKQGRKH